MESSSLPVNVRANDGQFTLNLYGALHWQALNDAQAKLAAGIAYKVPFTVLSAERIADFLVSGSNQGSSRAAQA